jgi:hypothetical protein
MVMALILGGGAGRKRPPSGIIAASLRDVFAAAMKRREFL